MPKRNILVMEHFPNKFVTPCTSTSPAEDIADVFCGVMDKETKLPCQLITGLSIS